MSYTKIVFACLVAILITLTGCSKTVVHYTCPFGVGHLTKTDYETMLDENLISDQFVTWLLSTNLYCEANKGE